MSEGRHRVVVVGGGFGGLFATRALHRAPVEVTLIDRNGYHLFQPLLYQVATGILSQGEIARPLREILRHQENASILLGEVDTIDLAARTVTSSVLDRSTTTPYDSLVLATGATHSYFGNDGFAVEAPGLKSIDDALEIRGRVFEAFELADQATDEAERRRHLTFVVIGGGPTGIEMAGQISELSRQSLRRNFRHVDPESAKVVLLEAGPVLLPTFGSRLSACTKRSLVDLGVDVRLNAKVVDVGCDAVAYERDGALERVEATTKIWAAGVRASPVGALLTLGSDATTNRSGQVVVNADCSLAGHPEVFVVGDLMALAGTPAVAQVAIQSGEHAARTISRRLEGRSSPGSFRYRDRGSLATISRFQAVASIRSFRLTGPLAWLLWLGVHLLSLCGFANRAFVGLHWALTFTSEQRAERAATPHQAMHSTTRYSRTRHSHSG